MSKNPIKKVGAAITVLAFILVSRVFATESNGFADVEANAYYAKAVQYCQEQGLIRGTSATLFSPDREITRSQLTTILWRQADSPAAGNAVFSDVDSDAYYAPAVAWAAEQGIVTGIGNGRFGPNDTVTRGQLASILWRMDGSPVIGTQTAFTDQDMIPAYAVNAVAWAQAEGIMSGKNGNLFDPMGNATRGQTATVLYHFLNPNVTESETADRQIRVTTQGGDEAVFTLNDSSAATSFYEQLPMSITVENFSDNEKIFYLSERLNIDNTPLAKGPAGTLTYYEPWGNVAMYYGTCGGADGLYALGEAISGIENISEITGEIRIEAMEQPETDWSSGRSQEALKAEVSSATQKSSLTLEEKPLQKEENSIKNLGVTVGDKTFMATLGNNKAAEEWAAMLPMTVTMGDMNGNEKYFYFPQKLSTNATNPSQIHTGDIMLYGSDCLVLFYESFSSSYQYTPLGTIDDPAGFAEAVGSGSVEVTFAFQ